MKLTSRIRAALLSSLVGVSLSGCVDASRLSGPDGGTIAMPVALAPVFFDSVTDDAAGPITRIRLEVTDQSTQTAIQSRVIEVDPDASTWLVELEVEVPALSELDIRVLLVLMSGDGVAAIEEWSGRTGVITLSASAPDRTVRSLAVYRGPPANLDVQSLQASLPGALLDGDRAPIQYQVTGGGEGTRVFLSTLDPNVLQIDGTEAIASGVGTGRVVVTAGPAADTLTVDVSEWAVADTEAVEDSGPSLDDSTTRLLPGLSNPAAAAEIASGLAALNAALASGRGGDILRALGVARAAISNYNGGDWGADGPELSLVLHSLDVLERSVRGVQGT